MRWFVVVPGALLTHVASDAMHPRLALAERHPDHVFDEAREGAAASWLWHRFGGTGSPVTAPYAWQAERGESPVPQTWFCEPVHFVVARDHLLLSPLDAPVDAAETRALCEAANAVARAAGATLHAASGATGATRWMMQFDRPWDLATTPLHAAVGRSIFELMPTGADALRWRKLSSDIQVEWHQLPGGARREERGQLPVNALWLHGGGTWAPLPNAPFAAVTADDPVVRGWALAAGVPAEHVRSGALPPAAAGDTLTVDASLLELDPDQMPGGRLHDRHDGTLADARSRAWQALLERLCAGLDTGRNRGPATIELLLAGERTIRHLTLRHADRWRFWRRARRAQRAELLVE